MFCEEYEKENFKFPVLGNIISRCIQDMSQDVESQVIANNKAAKLFCQEDGRVN
jgi:hypothetical protein